MNKEEIDIFYKDLYQQDPITLLTNENLRVLELHCENTLRYERGKLFKEHSLTLELIRKYKELETSKQKLIDKLEEDIKVFGNYEERKQMDSKQLFENDGMWNYAKYILEIVKGEKNE